MQNFGKNMRKMQHYGPKMHLLERTNIRNPLGHD